MARELQLELLVFLQISPDGVHLPCDAHPRPGWTPTAPWRGALWPGSIVGVTRTTRIPGWCGSATTGRAVCDIPLLVQMFYGISCRWNCCFVTARSARICLSYTVVALGLPWRASRCGAGIMSFAGGFGAWRAALGLTPPQSCYVPPAASHHPAAAASVSTPCVVPVVPHYPADEFTVGGARCRIHLPGLRPSPWEIVIWHRDKYRRDFRHAGSSAASPPPA